MTGKIRDRRLVQLPQEHRAHLAELIEIHGIADTCRLCGLGRSALLAAVARGYVLPGSAAIVREFMRGRVC